MSEDPQTFTVLVHHEDGGSLWAEVEELPGCFAAGANMEELWEVLADSIGTYLSTPEHHQHVTLVDSGQQVERRTIAVAVSA